MTLLLCKKCLPKRPVDALETPHEVAYVKAGFDKRIRLTCECGHTFYMVDHKPRGITPLRKGDVWRRS